MSDGLVFTVDGAVATPVKQISLSDAGQPERNRLDILGLDKARHLGSNTKIT